MSAKTDRNHSRSSARFFKFFSGRNAFLCSSPLKVSPCREWKTPAHHFLLLPFPTSGWVHVVREWKHARWIKLAAWKRANAVHMEVRCVCVCVCYTRSSITVPWIPCVCVCVCVSVALWWMPLIFRATQHVRGRGSCTDSRRAHKE